MTDVAVDDETGATRTDGGAPATWALAAASAGAGLIHAAMATVHADIWQDRYGFAAAAVFQVGVAGALLVGRPGRRLVALAVAGNAFLVAMWAWSRTAGLPWGETAGVAEEVGPIDLATVLLQVVAVAVGARLLLAPAGHGGSGRSARIAPAMAAVGALAVALVAISSPDAANHQHGSGTLTGLALEAEKVDEARCDRDVNPPAYWEEAEALGVDTRWAGAPPGVAATSSDGHDHGGGASTDGGTTTTTRPDPLAGRGSPGLDQLVSATALAATSEIEAANLIGALAHATDEDYDAWLWWLQTSGSLAHDHSSTFTSEDGSGHGGHVGPQPWKALTDPAECERLHEELALARKTALRYPTAQDAMDDGYRLVAPYLPGIASHFIKGSLIDGVFEIDQPEMLLYDGNGPDANIVGLSYYLYHRGNNKPTQGFTGDNDSGHRHLGLCSAPGGGIIGDSTTTEEECAARGGSKSDGSAGWMSHAWVVPGCESPWGVFSAASPVLDDALGADNGGPHCAGSSVRDRYDMGDAPEADGQAVASSRTLGD
ncbi:MAG: hypothetical protein KDB04_01730 [Acidimicrobiales bacterium]|nr:hypothetical protein [Acidimicrobiales bacterium]HRW37103.1 hypothetical protein [Aquihabitans sp.]